MTASNPLLPNCSIFESRQIRANGTLSIYGKAYRLSARPGTVVHICANQQTGERWALVSLQEVHHSPYGFNETPQEPFGAGYKKPDRKFMEALTSNANRPNEKVLASTGHVESLCQQLQQDERLATHSSSLSDDKAGCPLRNLPCARLALRAQDDLPVPHNDLHQTSSRHAACQPSHDREAEEAGSTTKPCEHSLRSYQPGQPHREGDQSLVQVPESGQS